MKARQETQFSVLSTEQGNALWSLVLCCGVHLRLSVAGLCCLAHHVFFGGSAARCYKNEASELPRARLHWCAMFAVTHYPLPQITAVYSSKESFFDLGAMPNGNNRADQGWLD